jgi:hypothetical protein
MNAWRNIIIRNKTISWLLVVSVLLITLMPAHYHLNHLFSDSSSEHGHSTDHAHVVDFHFIADETDQSHHGEDTTVFTANPDGIVKKANPEFFPFILLVILLVLLPILNKRIRICLDYCNLSLKQSCQHFSPPLRAPPLH